MDSLKRNNLPASNSKLRLWKIPFLILLIIGTVFTIRRHQPREVPFQKEEGVIFGTEWHATYQCDSSLHADIVQELQRVDASLSMFNPRSTLSRINAGESSETDSLLRIVLTQAFQISQATHGCFDVTVAPLVNAWGFGFKNGALPDSAQVDSLLQFVGWQRVSLDSLQLVKSDPRIVLDLSAIAKGFGVDQVASLFRRHGIQNFMIEIGGEIVVHGHNPRGKEWIIGVNKPVEDELNPNKETKVNLSLTNCAMATSGNYRNFYIDEKGQKRAHTIDPHTGYPVQHSILSSTVIAPTCSMADAFATSFMVMGIDSAKSTLARHPELQAYFILSSEQGEMETWQTDSLANYIAR